MNETEIIVAILTLLGVSIPAYFLFRRGRKADDASDENTANSLIYTGYDKLVKNLQDDRTDLRHKLEEAEKARDQRLMGAVNNVQTTKADREYVEELEKRLETFRERSWARADADEARLDRALQEVADCRKEMDEKIAALEARLKGQSET